jgi:phosphoglycolate phosphatase-like HAD superfamily hydrolase
MKDIKVVAFDCDGVLFDTEEANWAYYNHLLKHFRRPTMTPEQFAYAHQHTLNESIAYLFEDEEAIAAAYDYRKTMDYSAYY